MNISSPTVKVFGKKIFSLLKRIGVLTARESYTAYLVGGPVRDLLLSKMVRPRRRNSLRGKDLDIVISGDSGVTKETAISLAKKLAEIWQRKRVELKIYKHFGTATILFPKENFQSENKQGLEIDFVFSRKETYPSPGKLPEVEPGNIQDDLHRRDFTINSMAIELSPEHFGKLLDPMEGREDLERKLIRVHHQRSFLDDPTRILRAASFAGRYDFQIEKKTLSWLKDAIKKNAFSTVSRQRFREEMVTLLQEKKVGKCLDFLSEWDGLKFLSPFLKRKRKNFFRTRFINVKTDDWLVNLLILIEELSYKETEKLVQQMVLTARERKIILETKKYLPSVTKMVKSKYAQREIYHYFSLLPGTGLTYLGITNPQWEQMINIFQERQSKSNPVINGEDLKRIGYPPGPVYRKILTQIREEKILGNLPVNLPKRKTKEVEIKFVNKHFFLA